MTTDTLHLICNTMAAIGIVAFTITLCAVLAGFIRAIITDDVKARCPSCERRHTLPRPPAPKPPPRKP